MEIARIGGGLQAIGTRPAAGLPPAGGLPGATGSPAAGGAASKPGGFVELFGKMVDEVNDKQLAAEQAVRDLASGRTESVHDVMIAEAEAEISFRLLSQTRNKLVDAYKEIMRMQI